MELKNDLLQLDDNIEDELMQNEDYSIQKDAPTVFKQKYELPDSEVSEREQVKPSSVF